MQHLWSIIPMQKPYECPHERVEIPSDEGGCTTLDLFVIDPSPSAHWVLVLPGLAGGSDKVIPGLQAALVTQQAYTRSIVRKAHQLGMNGAILNWRGYNCELKSPKVFTVGDLHDVDACARLIKSRSPDGKIVGVGFSAGSSLVVKYLGWGGSESLLDAGGN